jgi:hypothetical protein
MPAVSLDDIGNAYSRVQRSIQRGMEDAADFGDELRWSALTRDQIIVDAAFFILIFGQLERCITDLAVYNVKRVEAKTALRDAKFERRLEIALRDDRGFRDRIEGWYSVRSDVVHGQDIAAAYDVGAVLATARQIEALLDRIAR